MNGDEKILVKFSTNVAPTPCRDSNLPKGIILSKSKVLPDRHSGLDPRSPVVVGDSLALP